MTEKQNISEIQSQTRLIRSQTRGLWVSVFVSILIASTSLYYTYSIYNNSEQEFCSIAINQIKTDYKTEIYCGLMTSDSKEKEYYITVKYKATIINLSKNPISLISYFCIHESQIDSSHLLRFIKTKVPDEITKSYEQSLTTPKKLEPGDYSEIDFDTYIRIDTTIIELLKKKIAEPRNISITKLAELFYKNGIDFFGNKISCTISENGSISSLSYDTEDLIKDYPFTFIIRTAKGKYFFRQAKWYSNDYMINLPFLESIMRAK